jgi:hypothetical protein
VSGHVFVVGADLTRLACDDVLVPTDRDLHVDVGWSPLLAEDGVEGWNGESVQVRRAWPGSARVLQLPATEPRCTWLIDTVGDEGRGLPWLLDGVREALRAVAGREVPEPAHKRARRLVGLPALGTGWGAAAGNRGTLLEQLLPVLSEAAERFGYDVALALREPSDLAAAQRVRRDRHGGWDVPAELREVAQRLGRQAQGGELAVFAGAGVSAAAGLPTWGQLLDELAERCCLEPALRAGLAELPAQDAAALLARELGRQELAAYVQERFGRRPYTLAHAVLAALPVQELVTTNYDPLLELAAAGAHRDLRVLPFEQAAAGKPWLLKLHGDAAHPESVVLTRDQYLQTGDHRAALSGVLHALLLTRHVLFVGSSMLDDDLIRIAHEVRTALRTPDATTARRTGTVLSLTEDPARARLWEQDVDTVAMAAAGTPTPQAARRLEIFLDLLGCLACPPTGYLLDPAYRGLLGDDEAALADALRGLEDQVQDGARKTWAWAQIEAVLRRLGATGGDDSSERRLRA